jgi:putative sigma-54 modulation protein
MRINFTFRNVASSPAIKSYASEKIARFQRYLRAPLQATVTVSLERHHHHIDVVLNADGKRYAGHSDSEDMYASIDMVMDKIDRQIRDGKAAVVTNKRHGKASSKGR